MALFFRLILNYAIQIEQVCKIQSSGDKTRSLVKTNENLLKMLVRMTILALRSVVVSLVDKLIC
jgi:hypothetical protein